MNKINIKQGKDLVKFLFNEIGQTPRDASLIARAIKKIAGDLYTEAELDFSEPRFMLFLRHVQHHERHL